MSTSFLILSLMSAMLFVYVHTPLILGMILIIHTISLSLFLGSMLKSFWFIYLLILIFIGGMLVLFIYVTSIFPNEKFFFNQKSTLNISLIILMTTFTLVLLISMFNTSLPLSSLKNTLNMEDFFITFETMKIFSSQTSITLLFLVNYLFYCMMIVVKITNFFKGPLRKSSYD